MVRPRHWCLLAAAVLAFFQGDDYPRSPVGRAGSVVASRLATNPHAHLLPGLPLRAGLDPEEKLTAFVDGSDVRSALLMYGELTGRERLPSAKSMLQKLDESCGYRLSRWRLVTPARAPDTGVSWHRDGRLSARELKEQLETIFEENGLVIVPVQKTYFRAVLAPVPSHHAAPRDAQTARRQ